MIDITKEPLIDIDGQAEEMKRIQKLMKKFKVNEDVASKLGIIARSSNIPIDKKALRGVSPDDDDKKNIDNLIETYNQAFPYPHEQSIQFALEEGKKFTKKIPRATRRKNKKAIALAVHIPVPFNIALKAGYPLIFSDKVQFAWFLENFPQFNLKG